ncbi:MAG: aldehyde ferredoxin oxidoreductase family protein [Chloroflexi bacterium]|nr:aldehyde ferredoxin oxidoreductase family protein [Chloroflexota bacterium]
MGYGSTGRLLQIDLSDGSIRCEQLAEEFYRHYPGGKALAGYLLLNNLPRGTDPLGPANLLVLAAGLLTGAALPTASRFTAAARSPLTGAYGESEAGGYWGPELKMAGFDAITITGRAETPVYLWIRDGHVEIRDARHLWKIDPEQAQAAIRQELGDKLIRVLQIGLGGENLVRYAAITNELRHYNGRTGMGAVMGSKNLKAIAVRGSGRYADFAHDPRALAELGKHLAKKVSDHPQIWDLKEKGTPGLVNSLNAVGILPTRNFRQGAFDQVGKISWEAYQNELFTARRSCYACAVRCKREVVVNDRHKVSAAFGGPEYEALAGLGSDCGVDDLQAIAKANELCGRHTLDVISTGATIAFAMECFEHGLITLAETDGIVLRFGNADAMLTMIEMIARREGIGKLLAEGTRRAAQVIGGDAPYFAMHVKGQELPMHDPRGKAGVGLGYATSDTGAEHLVSFHDTQFQNPDSLAFQAARSLGLTEALPARELSKKKAAQYALLENWSSLGKVLGLCYFGPAPRAFIQVDEVVAIVNAATGWNLAVGGLLQIGERATNLARAFNVREGFSKQDDALPERLFTPLENGALAGAALSKQEFEHALQALYGCKGWDANGVPTRERLESLGLGQVADLILSH